jgi:hypothetical protein
MLNLKPKGKEKNPKSSKTQDFASETMKAREEANIFQVLKL